MEIPSTPATVIATASPRIGIARRVWGGRLLLVAIMLLAAYFRFMSITNWDAGTGQHPDERFFTNVSSSVRLPASLGEYLDSSRSPLNPRSYSDFSLYVYGPFPVLLTRAVAVSLSPPEALPAMVQSIAGPPLNGQTSFGEQIANPERSFPRLWPLIGLLNPEGRNLASYGEIVKVGRVLAALFDIGSILMIFQIGRRLFNRRVGLLAALLSALAVMQIQQSHFFVDPIFSTFFTLVALYWGVRLAQGGGPWVAVALGLAIGVGMPNRITLATLGLMAIAAALLAALRWAMMQVDADSAVGSPAEPETDPEPEADAEAAGWRAEPKLPVVPPADRFDRLLGRFSERFFAHSLPLLVLAGFVTLLAYRSFQPDAFSGSRPDSPSVPGERPLDIDALAGLGFLDIRPDPRFVANLITVRALVTGEYDFPPGQQWVGRPSYSFPWLNMVLWGMGPALGLTAWLGMLGFGVYTVRLTIDDWRKRRFDNLRLFAPWVLISWVLFYFLWQGAQFAITMRYLLPIYGPLIIFAAWALLGLWQWGRSQGIGDREWGIGQQAASSKQPVRLAWVRSVTAMRRVAPIALPIVLIVTAGWAYAFSRIYTRPHARVIAAEWALAQIPPGSKIAAEIWDDPLPLQVAGYATWGTIYQGIETAPYAEDDLNKYFGEFNREGVFQPGLLNQLDEADYITLTSNRVYDSTARLPARYPALRNYYHYLFSGELGFELAAEITSYPTIMGLRIPDQAAEEAFTVYDHPRVLIFKKTPAYTRATAEQLITGAVNWGEVYKNPLQIADRNQVALRISASEWPTYRAGGTYADLFTLAPWYGAVAPFIWLLIVEALGLAMFALLFRLLPGLPDRGYSLAKILGLLAVAYPAWLLGSLKIAPFSPQTVWICALPLLGAGVLAIIIGRDELLAFWRRQRRALLCAEGLFLGFMLLGLLLRWLNPDLWHPARGGEKPMDFAYLNAVLKSAQFPPYDPWHAGGYINYYYFGFVLVGTLIHLTTVEPSIGYNLAVATLFGLSALGAWGVVYNLLAPSIRRWTADGGRWMVAQEAFSADGVTRALVPPTVHRPPSRLERRALISAALAPAFMLLLGNLAQAIWFIDGYAAKQGDRPEWAFWDATRIVQGTVNEFPFFTFLFADLHAHMIVMPLSLALLGLGLAWARGRANDGRWTMDGGRWAARWNWFTVNGLPSIILLLLMGLLAGALRVTNTWDYPTYVGLTGATLALVAWGKLRKATSTAQKLLIPFLHFVLPLALIVLVGNLLFAPFTASFTTESSGAELLRDGLPPSLLDQVLGAERTSAWDLLRLYGHWIVIALSGGLLLVARRAGRGLALGLGLAFAAFTALAVWRAWAAPTLLVPLLIGATALGWDMRRLPARRLLPMLWAIGALGLCLLVELVVVKGDVGRMNTVFKFGIHAWTLFALSAAVVVPQLWEHCRLQIADCRLRAEASPKQSAIYNLQSAIYWGWGGTLALLFAAALVYPLTATPARIADRWRAEAPHTLDGAAFFASVSAASDGPAYSLNEDAKAIDWLKRNVSGTPVIVEAHQPSYQWAGRIATYTGLPTILGWEWHQVQQRNAVDAGPVIAHRQAVVNQIYSTPDSGTALDALQQYGVEYLYVGGVERSLYDTVGMAKFAYMAQRGELREVFADGETRIYQVAQPGKPTMLTSDLPIVAPSKKTIPLLDLDQPVNELPSAGRYAWNTLTGASSLPAALTWLVLFYGIALLGLPLATLIFGRWRDGGWAWARLIGLLLWGYTIWLPTSLGLWRYDSWGILGGLLLVLALNGLLLWQIGRRASGGRGAGDDGRASLLQAIGVGLSSIGQRLRTRRRELLISEAIFLTGFGLLAGLRALNPDLWHPAYGGEKPMEFGFLNAILRSPVMPPYDPFYSDGYINYYYYGLYLVSLPIKAAGIDPAIGFNLAVATLFAMLLAGAYTIVAQATGRLRYGLIGAAGLGLAGNLAGFFAVGSSRGFEPVWEALQKGGLGQLGANLGDWYWWPSRVIPFTINEFPFWTFLFADLHPHMIALPIALLAVALCYRVMDGERWMVDGSVAAAGDEQSERAYHRLASTGHLLLLALALGTLAVTNSWDFPTYGLLAGLALLGGAWRRAGRAERGVPLRALLWAGLVGIGVGLGGLALYAPFFDHYYALIGGVGLVQPDATVARDYAAVYGLFLAVILPLLVGAALRSVAHLTRLRAAARGPTALLGGGALLAALIGIALVPQVGLRLALLLAIMLGGLLLVQRRSGTGAWFTTLLITLGMAVSLGVETVYVRDHLAGGDSYRMNSVFKFGQQIGVLFALAAAIGLPHMLRGLQRLGGPTARTTAITALVGLAALAAVFPLAGVPSRISNRFAVDSGPTLDGLAFMDQASFDYDCAAFGGCEPGVSRVAVDLRGDGAAIDWLNRTIDGTPVVLQSNLWFYRAYGIRVAANTGLPTVISSLHASEQRDGAFTAPRDRDVEQLFRTLDVETALRVLAKYRVDYLYIGGVERAFYPSGLNKFASMSGSYLDPVYNAAGVQIYRVRNIPPLYAQPAPVEFASAPQPNVPQPSAPQPSAEQAAGLSEMEEANRVNPTDGPTAFGLAERYRALGRLNDAAQVLAVAARSNPSDIGVHHLWGDILAEAGRYDEAEQAMLAAAQAQPSAGNWHKLAAGLLAWGKPDKAEIAFTQVLSIDPGYAEAYYGLGVVYAQRGDNQTAVDALETYLELAPNGPSAKKARALLEKVK